MFLYCIISFLLRYVNKLFRAVTRNQPNRLPNPAPVRGRWRMPQVREIITKQGYMIKYLFSYTIFLLALNNKNIILLQKKSRKRYISRSLITNFIRKNYPVFQISSYQYPNHIKVQKNYADTYIHPSSSII